MKDLRSEDRRSKVMLAIDGYEAAAAALPVAAELARALGAMLVLLNVLEPGPLAASPLAMELLDHVMEEASRLGIQAEPAVAVERPEGAVESIVRAAIAHDADVLVVTASTGDREDVLLGGEVGYGVVHETNCPVLVVPARDGKSAPGSALARVLLAVDGSTPAEHARDLVVRLGRPGARALAVHVLEQDALVATAVEAAIGGRGDGRWDLEARADANRLLAATTQVLARAGYRALEHVSTGTHADVAAEIVRAAEEFDAGLIAMGSHGRGGLTLRLLGSVAQRVLRTAGRPVLVVR